MALQHELDMSFNYEEVPYGQIKDGTGREATPKIKEVFANVKPGEKDMVAAWNRTHNPGRPEKRMWFNFIVINDTDVVPTLTSGHGAFWDFSFQSQISNESIANASTFPQDYDFGTAKVEYICGMSVPPLMIKRIVNKLLEQGVFDVK